jgi:CBS domain-containing protein
MKISEVMTPRVEWLEAGASLQEAARRMKERNIGFLPVFQGDQMVGVLTDRDIVVRAIAQGKDPATTTVAEIMSPRVVWCFDDEDIDHVERLLKSRQIHRLPVLDRQRRLVGVVSLSDLAVRGADEHLVAQVLERVAEASVSRNP